MEAVQGTFIMLLQQTNQDGESTWSLVASIISTVAWSVSFYGQVYENYKFKNVQGFSLDYLFLNLIGYTFYGIYSTVGYFTTIKGAGIFVFNLNQQIGTVLLGDLIFVYHAIPLVIIQAVQCYIYPRGKNHLSKWAQTVGYSLIFIVSVEFIFTQIFTVIAWTQFWNPVSVLGYGKLIISFVKYSPAVYWNYKRKSTKGWSIFNIILDLVGGSFSLASGSISMENGLNVTKLLLAILTVFYDIIFVVQHYVLYRPKNEQQEVTGLIENNNVEDLITDTSQTDGSKRSEDVIVTSQQNEVRDDRQ